MKEIALFIAAGAALFIGASLPVLTTKHYRIRTNKLSAPIRLVQIADLHACQFGKEQKSLLRTIHKLSPDIICLTGDHFDDRVTENLPAKKLIQVLSHQYPIFFVEGNHELYCHDREKNLHFLRTHKVTILNGNQVKWSKGDQTITICGVSDPILEDGNRMAKQKAENTHDERPFAQRLAHAADNPEGYMILLSHRPERNAEYREHPFDLVLSGHAHGGQWRIPFLLNGTFAPHQGWFPRRAGGIYRDTPGQIHIVSRGLSTLLKVPRLFNPPELVCIDIIGTQS